MKYLVAPQQCKGNTFLPFYCNSQQYCIAESDRRLSSTNGTPCCFWHFQCFYTFDNDIRISTVRRTHWYVCVVTTIITKAKILRHTYVSYVVTWDHCCVSACLLKGAVMLIRHRKHHYSADSKHQRCAQDAALILFTTAVVLVLTSSLVQ